MTLPSPNQYPVTIYTSDSALRRPCGMVAQMFRSLWESRELSLRLTARDLKAQYRQTALGFVWALLPALATTGSFAILNASKVVDFGRDIDIPYPAYALLGSVLWQVFADSLSMPMQTMVKNKAMLTKINFHHEALVLTGVGQVAFRFTISLLLLAGVLLILRVPVGVGVLALPLIAMVLCLIGTVIGVLVAPLGILYQDVLKALPMVTTFWMLITPVVYPAQTQGLLGVVSQLNPVSPWIVIGKGLALGQTGGLPWMHGGLVLIGAVALLFVGWVIYRVSMPILIERMQA